MAVDIAAAASAATGSEGGNPTPSPSPSPAPSPSPSPAPSSTGSSGGTAGTSGGNPTPASGPRSGASGNAAGAGVGTPQWMGVRDAARTYGYDLGDVQDDHTAMQRLILEARRAQQNDQLAQYGQEYLRHASQFQQWQRQQQEAAQRQQQESKQWFKAPEWDANWRNLITRDATTGEYKAVPGAPPDIVQKYLSGLQHQQQFLERFAFDPISAIKPGIEQIVQEMAQQMVQQQLGGYKDQTFAQSFINENRSWLYQADQNQQPVRDPRNGQPVLSQWGQAFKQYVGQAMQAGIQNEQMRANYALGMVQRDYLAYTQQVQAQNYAGNAGKDAFLQNAQAAQAAQRPAPQPQPAGAGANLSQAAGRRGPKVPLSERLKQRFAQEGITEQTLKAQTAR